MKAPDWLYSRREPADVRVRRWGSWRVTLLSLTIADETGDAEHRMRASWTLTFWRLYLMGGPTDGICAGLSSCVTRWDHIWERRSGMGLALAWVLGGVS